MLATAPSCCVPSLNQMMVAAGLALKALHVRLWGVPACSRITGPPSILVSSGGTGGKRRTKSAQDAANCVRPSQPGNATLAQLTITIYSACEEASLSPQLSQIALLLLLHSCYYCLILYSPLLLKGTYFDGRLSQITPQGRRASFTASLPSIPFHLLLCREWPDGQLHHYTFSRLFLHSS